MHSRPNTALVARLLCGIAAVLVTAAVASPAVAQEPSPTPTVTPTATPAAPAAPAPAAPAPAAPAPAAGKSALTISYPWYRHILTLAAKTPGKAITPTITNQGKGAAMDVTITVDYSKLASSVTVLNLPGEPDGCSADGEVLTCKLANIEADTEVRPPAITLKPAKGAEPGKAGSITAQITARNDDGSGTLKTTFEVEIAAGGADLVAVAHDVTAGPGKSVAGKFEFYNDGDAVIPSIGFRIGTSAEIAVTAKDENCQTDNGQLYCVIPDVNLGPDELIELNDAIPTTLTVSKRAPGPRQYYGEIYGTPLTGTVSPELRKLAAKARTSAKKPHVARTKARAKIQESIPDLNFIDNLDSFAISTTANPADLQAFAAKISGPRGKKIPVKFSVRNNGPADGKNWDAMATITAPTGTELTTTDKQCEAVTAKRVYHCSPPGDIEPGKTQSYAFGLTITAAAAGSDGSIAVDGGRFDTTPGNNKAPITVTVTTGTAPSAQPGPGGGGSLPVTGAAIGGVLAAGATLLGLGGVLVVASRRRRVAS